MQRTMTTRRQFLDWLSDNLHFRVTGYVKEHPGRSQGTYRRFVVRWLQSLGNQRRAMAALIQSRLSGQRKGDACQTVLSRRQSAFETRVLS
jgi:hypothetical protein